MKISRVLQIVFLVLAIAGFIDATYLTVQHFLGKIPPCAITSGCETVLTSQWNNILGIPVSLLGAINYLVLLILTILYFTTESRKIMFWTALLSTIGFGFSIWFVSLQFFVIKSICIYCMVSAAISTLLFVTGMLIVKSISSQRPRL
jgi:uncharacterized membrane protein